MVKVLVFLDLLIIIANVLITNRYFVIYKKKTIVNYEYCVSVFCSVIKIWKLYIALS